MNVNEMTAKDFLDLYCFVQLKNKQIYLDYINNFRPTLKDVEDYSGKVEQFEEMWRKDKSVIHKPIAFRKYEENYKEDNDFKFCLEVGHKFELWVENEFKKYGVDLGMYYDNKQFRGENKLGLEIKHDSKLEETNNVYIEYEALNKEETEFYKSGILKEDDCKYWLIGTEKEYYIFYKEDLLKLYQKLTKDSKTRYQYKDGNRRKIYYGLAEKRTSKGIVISREKCREMMIADNIQDFLYKRIL